MTPELFISLTIEWTVATIVICIALFILFVLARGLLKIISHIADRDYGLYQALSEVCFMPFTQYARLKRKYERLNRRHDRMLKLGTIRKDIAEMRGRIMEQALKTPNEYLKTNRRRNQ